MALYRLIFSSSQIFPKPERSTVSWPWGVPLDHWEAQLKTLSQIVISKLYPWIQCEDDRRLVLHSWPPSIPSLNLFSTSAQRFSVGLSYFTSSIPQPTDKHYLDAHVYAYGAYCFRWARIRHPNSQNCRLKIRLRVGKSIKSGRCLCPSESPRLACFGDLELMSRVWFFLKWTIEICDSDDLTHHVSMCFYTLLVWPVEVRICVVCTGSWFILYAIEWSIRLPSLVSTPWLVEGSSSQLLKPNHDQVCSRGISL